MENFNLDKMLTELKEEKAHYFFEIGEQKVELNQLVGKNLKIHFKQEINCTHCQKVTKKSYSGGYCYPCSIKLAECDMCILKPEQCHYSKGTCREPEWGQSHCMIPHYIYLANSSGLKVGITRTTQIPTRWIDQGAIEALPIIKVQTRYQSGVIEKLLSSQFNDKTDWRKMLKGQIEPIDLYKARDEIFDMFGDELDSFDDQFGDQQIEVLESLSTTVIDYPVIEYPEKVNSLSLDKFNEVGGLLKGIKGQYLIFDSGVINIRSHTGYKVTLEY